MLIFKIHSCFETVKLLFLLLLVSHKFRSLPHLYCNNIVVSLNCIVSVLVLEWIQYFPSLHFFVYYLFFLSQNKTTLKWVSVAECGHSGRHNHDDDCRFFLWYPNYWSSRVATLILWKLYLGIVYSVIFSMENLMKFWFSSRNHYLYPWNLTLFFCCIHYI